VTVLTTSGLPRCSALLADLESLGLDSALTAPEPGDDGGQGPAALDAEAPEGEPLELPPIDPERVVYLESLAEWIDTLDPAEYAEARSEIGPETLAALGLADDGELVALGLPLDYAGELPGTLDEMAEHAAWSTSRKVIVLGAVVIMAGAAGWWLWKRHKTRKAAKPERVAKVPSMPRARTTTGLAGSLPRPWAI